MIPICYLLVAALPVVTPLYTRLSGDTVIVTHTSMHTRLAVVWSISETLVLRNGFVALLVERLVPDMSHHSTLRYT